MQDGINRGKKELEELEEKLLDCNVNRSICKNCQSGLYVQLHDDNKTAIHLDGCPWDFDWTFETYLLDYYGQYQNHQLPNGVPLNQEGKWIKQALSFIAMCEEKDREEQLKKKK